MLLVEALVLILVLFSSSDSLLTMAKNLSLGLLSTLLLKSLLLLCSVLSTHSLREHTDIVVLLDNKAIFVPLYPAHLIIIRDSIKKYKSTLTNMFLSIDAYHIHCKDQGMLSH